MIFATKTSKETFYGTQKLGRPTDQRLAVLRNQASELLWYGKIETTVDRAKSVRSIAEKLITLAINTYEDTVKVTKTKTNLKGEKVEVEFTNDGPKTCCTQENDRRTS